MTVVPLVDLVTDRGQLFLVWLEEPSFSHVVRNPKESDRSKDQRYCAFDLPAQRKRLNDNETVLTT
jgi:hypothetical protein